MNVTLRSFRCVRTSVLMSLRALKLWVMEQRNICEDLEETHSHSVKLSLWGVASVLWADWCLLGDVCPTLMVLPPAERSCRKSWAPHSDPALCRCLWPLFHHVHHFTLWHNKDSFRGTLVPPVGSLTSTHWDTSTVNTVVSLFTSKWLHGSSNCINCSETLVSL